MNYILMSIKPEYAKKIAAGEKAVEVRRSNLNLEIGDVILIYASKPQALIIGSVRVALVERLPKEALWAKHREKIGISLYEYELYLNAKPSATAIHLSDFRALKSPLSLQTLRKLFPSLLIPQSYLYLNRNGTAKYCNKLVSYTEHGPGERILK
jgi:predicted transcriptional regulator